MRFGAGLDVEGRVQPGRLHHRFDPAHAVVAVVRARRGVVVDRLGQARALSHAKLEVVLGLHQVGQTIFLFNNPRPILMAGLQAAGSKFGGRSRPEAVLGYS